MWPSCHIPSYNSLVYCLNVSLHVCFHLNRCSSWALIRESIITLVAHIIIIYCTIPTCHLYIHAVVAQVETNVIYLLNRYITGQTLCNKYIFIENVEECTVKLKDNLFPLWSSVQENILNTFLPWHVNDFSFYKSPPGHSSVAFTGLWGPPSGKLLVELLHFPAHL